MMTSKHWILVTALTALAIVGCATPDNTTEQVTETAQSLVVTYDAADVALEEVAIDLTVTRAVYVLDAFESADLAGLTVITHDGARLLRDVLGVLPAGEVSLVLGAEPERVDAFLDGETFVGAAESTNDGLGVSVQALTKLRCCDDCEYIGGGGIGPVVCRGCRGCDG